MENMRRLIPVEGICLQISESSNLVKKVFFGPGTEIQVVCGQWQAVSPSPGLVPRIGGFFSAIWGGGLEAQPETLHITIARRACNVVLPGLIPALFLAGLHNKGPLLEKNYPEWKCYRDIAFYYKLFMWSKARDQLPRDNHHQLAAQLHWEYQSCPKLYRVQAFGTNLKCNSKGSRYASKADPSHFTMPHKVC